MGLIYSRSFSRVDEGAAHGSPASTDVVSSAVLRLLLFYFSGFEEINRCDNVAAGQQVCEAPSCIYGNKTVCLWGPKELEKISSVARAVLLRRRRGLGTFPPSVLSFYRRGTRAQGSSWLRVTHWVKSRARLESRHFAFWARAPSPHSHRQQLLVTRPPYTRNGGGCL